MFGAFLFSALMGTFGPGGFDAGSRSVVCELRFSPGVLVWYHVLTASGGHRDSQNAGAAGDGRKIERWHRPLQFIANWTVKGLLRSRGMPPPHASRWPRFRYEQLDAS